MRLAARNRAKRKSRLNHQRGSVMVEFLLTFPTFLLLCMFTLEVACMWMDRHIVRLAAFEAARTIAATDTPLEGDPCTVQANLSAGRSVAVRRIASISPSVPYLMDMMGLNFSTNLGFNAPSDNSYLRAAQRVLLRLPSAAALTSLTCTYDQDAVVVTLQYHRMPVMPFVDKVMYAVYKMTHYNALMNPIRSSPDKEVHFDASMRGIIEAKSANMGTLRSQVISALSSARTVGLGPDETAKMLSGIEGLNVSTLSGFVSQAEGSLSTLFSALPAIVSQTANSTMTTQEALLAAAMFATGLRLIPMEVTTVVQRRVQSPRVSSSDVNQDEEWQGIIKGVTKLAPSDSWRDWGKNMSRDPQFVNGGRPL